MPFRLLALTSVLFLSMPALAQDDAPSASEWSVKASGGLLDASPQRRPLMISVMVGIPYTYFGYGFPFGVSGRFMLPLVHDGFIPSLNDSFGLEFGVDFSLYGRATFGGFLAIPVEAMWTFYIFPRLAAYAKLGLALQLSLGDAACIGTVCAPGVTAYPIGTVGAMFKLTDLVWLRLEGGYPWLKFGVGFAF